MPFFKVFCMVYRFSNKNQLDVHMRLPVFHTSVKVNDWEYEWGRVIEGHGTGRLVKTRRSKMGTMLDDVIEIGEFYLDDDVDVDDHVERLAVEIACSNKVYHLLTNNCNHFSDKLCRRLTGKGPPQSLNRAANWSAFFAY